MTRKLDPETREMLEFTRAIFLVGLFIAFLYSLAVAVLA